MNRKRRYLKDLCQQIRNCIEKYNKDEDWVRKDDFLYNLCKNFPENKTLSIVLIKVTAIDRFYKAGLYRKRVKYEYVARRLCRLSIDEQLSRIGDKLTLRNVREVANIVLRVASSTSGSKEKFVVFASKYLHFHKPNVFPIIDKYSEKKMINISKKLGITISANNRYECFCRRIIEFKKLIEKVCHERYSYSQLDKFLYGEPYFS